MAIRVTCNGCGKSFQTDDKWAGRSTACPACKSALVIPTPPAADPVPQLIDDGWGPPIQATIPQASFVHYHKASNDAFKSGFNASLGCFLAGFVSLAGLFGGCVVLNVIMRPQIERANEEQRQKAQQDFDDAFHHNMDLIHEEQEKEYQRIKQRVNRGLR